MAIDIGSIFQNRYRIVKLLGKGGFGAVYRAWDMSLSHPCAVKENLNASPEAQRQFNREASLLANLSHPNLPRVTDYFFIAGQGQYLVMDFVEGDDLHTLLVRNQGPLPESQSLAWISQICDALTYLHTQPSPIIHRDIKPANIRLTGSSPDNAAKEQPKHPLAMLVDFGIAKVYDPKMETTMGARAVTPGYSPAEQYGLGQTDARSDIYALGATLYNLLTAHDPPESVQRNMGTRLTSPRTFNPTISPQVELAILRAMEMVPAQRFHSAAEFKAALTAPPVARLSGKEHLVQPARPAGMGLAERPVSSPDPFSRQPSLSAQSSISARDSSSAQRSSGWSSSSVKNTAVKNTVAKNTATSPHPAHFPATEVLRRFPWTWAAAAGGVLVLALIVAGIFLVLIADKVHPFGVGNPGRDATRTALALEAMTRKTLESAATLTPVATGLPSTPPAAGDPTFTPFASALPPVIPSATPTSSLEAAIVEPYCSMFNQSPVTVQVNQPVILQWHWDALTHDLVQQHIQTAVYEVYLDGMRINPDGMSDIQFLSDKNYYRVIWHAAVGVLSPGKHRAERYLSWTQMISDGWNTYGPGGKIESESDYCEILVQ